MCDEYYIVTWRSKRRKVSKLACFMLLQARLYVNKSGVICYSSDRLLQTLTCTQGVTRLHMTPRARDDWFI